jgi:hypothetical protein
VHKALATVVLSAAALVAGTVAATGPASADEATPAGGTATPTPACIEPAHARFDGRWSASEPGHLHATLRGPAGAVLCDDVSLNASVYLVPDTWDGEGFNHTAVPQHLVGAGHAPDLVFPKDTPVGTKLEADVTGYLPECSNYQVDLYTGDKLDEVGTKGHGGAFITGGLVKGDLQSDECTEPTPTTTTVPTTETSTGTSTSASTTETSTTTEPSTAHSSAVTTSTDDTGTTTVASTTGAASPSTTVAGTTTAAPTTSTAPALAFTGAAGTGSLVGLGAALLVGGLGITLLTASRRGRATHRG